RTGVLGCEPSGHPRSHRRDRRGPGRCGQGDRLGVRPVREARGDGLFDTEAVPEPYEVVRDIDQRFDRRIVMTVPDRHNAKLRRAIELVNADDDLYGLWMAANVNAVERLGMTDHGAVHVKIVMNIAVR